MVISWEMDGSTLYTRKTLDLQIKLLSEKADLLSGSACVDDSTFYARKTLDPQIKLLSEKANFLSGSACVDGSTLYSRKMLDPQIKLLSEDANLLPGIACLDGVVGPCSEYGTIISSSRKTPRHQTSLLGECDN